MTLWNDFLLVLLLLVLFGLFLCLVIDFVTLIPFAALSICTDLSFNSPAQYEQLQALDGVKTGAAAGNLLHGRTSISRADEQILSG